MPTTELTTSEVRYQEIPRLPGYRIGDDGSVWSRWVGRRYRVMHETWRRLRLYRRPSGHLSVNLGSKVYGVHRLVLEAFVGPCPSGMECRHLNGDPSDNRPENLAWGTRQENVADAIRHGTSFFNAGGCGRGETHYATNLDEGAIREIRRLAGEGWFQREIADRFGVSRTAISDILRQRTWKHVAV